MAHLKLEGNNITVRCNDDTMYNTTVYVNKNELDKLPAQISQAISEAVLAADKKHADEVDAMNNRLNAEVATIRGQLLGVPATKPEPQKRIIAPKSHAPAETTAVHQVPPRRSEIDMNWVETRLAEAAKAENGGMMPVAALYGNMSQLGTLLTASPEQQAAATRAVFTALSQIPSFMLNLNAMAQPGTAAYPAFLTLKNHLDKSKSLAGASPDVISAANVYIRYFILYLGASEKQDYALELGQLPNIKKAMNELQASMPDLKPLKGYMGSETVLAAALYIRRWNLEQQGVKPEHIQVWQTPETLAAAKRETQPPARVPVQQLGKDTTVDWSRREIKW